MAIKKGDTVFVRTGSDKGKTGRVLRVDEKKNAILVEGVNMCKRHQRPSQKNPKGGILSVERPVHLSNVALFVEIDGKPKPTRITRRVIQDGAKKRRIRIARLTGEEI
jgi:large subunit ribosomal protein L24